MRYAGAEWWAEAIDLSMRAERLRRQFFRYSADRAATQGWEPPVDLLETSEGLELTVALPGVRPGLVDVVVDGGDLVVTATRPVPLARAVQAVHRLEIPYGRFARRIRLPAGRYRLAEQSCDCGCLRLTLKRIGESP